MGDPKNIRKKYTTPSHPWIKSRIEDEKRIAKEFGTKNKKEIWKVDTVLKNFQTQAKKLIALKGDQAEVETKHLYRRMNELGLIQGEVSFDDILGLTLDDIMARRLQSIVFKKGLAKSVKQARQFIVHEHISVHGKVITSPSYLVTVKEESDVDFVTSSPIFSEDHAERASPERLAEMDQAKKKAAEEKAKEEAVAKEAQEKAKEEEAKKEAQEESSEQKDDSQEKAETKDTEKAEGEQQ